MNVVWSLAAGVLFGAKEAPGGLATYGMLPWIFVTIFLFYIIVLRPQRREQATQRSMLENLKKNDRVITVGGIVGVVTNVEREKDRIKLRVDEKTNTEMTFTFSAISRVLRDEAVVEKADKPAK